jgi:hypothetical protein
VKHHAHRPAAQFLAEIVAACFGQGGHLCFTRGRTETVLRPRWALSVNSADAELA